MALYDNCYLATTIPGGAARLPRTGTSERRFPRVLRCDRPPTCQLTDGIQTLFQFDWIGMEYAPVFAVKAVPPGPTPNRDHAVVRECT